MKPLIFHVDVNSAFLSWEASRRVASGEADLRLIPSAIGGDRDRRTGIILAKSIPAKKYHVTTGEPVAMALRKCPDLILAKPDFRLYDKCSRAFMDICRNYAPVVEKFSIDECFLDMTGTGLIYPDPEKTAHQIKDEIRDTLGFTVNIGIGSNKLLAKMASDFEKPDKVHTLYDYEISRKMWPLPVSDLFSVGASSVDRLHRASIFTIGDLAGYDLVSLQKLVGNKYGKQIHDYANGIDPSPVLPVRDSVKGYSNSTTLAEDVTTIEQANQILLALADSVGSRIRSDHRKALTISVTIRTSDFHNKSHQKKMFEPTDITSEIYSVSKQLLSELWQPRVPLRLLGISLTDLNDMEFEQQTLFPDTNRQKEQKIDQTIDEIRNKFGNNIISRGSILKSGMTIGKKHKAQLENRSQKDS